LTLKGNIDARIGNFQKNIFTFLENEELDEEEIYYWVPYPKSFSYVLPLSKQLNIVIRNKKSFNSDRDYHNEINRITSLLTNKRHECHAQTVNGLTTVLNGPPKAPLLVPRSSALDGN
jgi:hypothetical protein